MTIDSVWRPEWPNERAIQAYNLHSLITDYSLLITHYSFLVPCLMSHVSCLVFYDSAIFYRLSTSSTGSRTGVHSAIRGLQTHFSIHNLLLTVYCSLFTIHCSLFTRYSFSLSIVNCQLFPTFTLSKNKYRYQTNPYEDYQNRNRRRCYHRTPCLWR